MALLKQLQADSLTVQVFSDRDSMGAQAAADAAACLRKLLSEKDEVNMIFAAAPSQNETLAHLVREKDIDWTRVNAFHMDEYIGLPEGAPQSFGKYLTDHIFALVPFRSVHRIDYQAKDAALEAERYSALLREYPTDIVCLGIGENGHIAFNDPGEADFNDPKLVKIVTLDAVCRQQQVNDGCFATFDDVPKQALSLTIPALTKAGHLFCTVPAATKAWAVGQTVRAAISEQVPATVMRRHADATMYCDADSGKELL